MTNSVKPLVHWAVYKGYKIRFFSRSARSVTGICTTPDGEFEFQYDPSRQIVLLGGRQIHINEYGWEVEIAEL
jgi:putative hemolysin